jgi:glycerol-3-phosphate dehydrogenase (NAD(P)+)
LSRNRTLGVALGRGLTLEEATVAARHTAEGATSCRSVLELATAQGVDVPIIEHVAEVVSGRLSVADMAPRLLGRPRKHETA